MKSRAKTRHAAWFAAGVAIAGVVVAILFLRENAPSPPVRAATDASVFAPTARGEDKGGPAPAAASAGDRGATPASRPLQSSRLLDRYNTAKDGRVFAVEAWAKPAEGGRYYAAKVAGHCLAYRRFSEGIRPPAEMPHGQAPEVAQALLRSLCSGFTDDELTNFFRLRPENSHMDPVAAAGNAITAARRSGSRETLMRAVQSLLDLGDPLLMDDLGIRMALYRDDATGTYVYFAGVRHPVRDDPSIVAAFYLLPCGLGLDCGPRDPALGLLCVNTGQCHADRFDRLAAEMPGGRAGRKFIETMQWYEKLVSAVKRRDASAFVEPS